METINNKNEAMFTIDDMRKAFEGGRDSVEPELKFEHYGDHEPYTRKIIVKSFKQFMHETYYKQTQKMFGNKTKIKT